MLSSSAPTTALSVPIQIWLSVKRHVFGLKRFLTSLFAASMSDNAGEGFAVELSHC